MNMKRMVFVALLAAIMAPARLAAGGMNPEMIIYPGVILDDRLRLHERTYELDRKTIYIIRPAPDWSESKKTLEDLDKGGDPYARHLNLLYIEAKLRRILEKNSRDLDKFIRAHICLGHIKFLRNDYVKAIELYQRAYESCMDGGSCPVPTEMLLEKIAECYDRLRHMKDGSDINAFYSYGIHGRAEPCELCGDEKLHPLPDLSIFGKMTEPRDTDVEIYYE